MNLSRISRATAAIVLAVGVLDVGAVDPILEGRPHGGGVDIREAQQPCLGEQDRAIIQSRIRDNRARLRSDGRIPAARRGAPVPLLAWPLRAAGSAEKDFSYWSISNYVDQDPAGGILDYSCGTQTYDGHRGTDYFLWPFPWNKMDDDEVEIIAAAPGTIILKQDGNFDRSCSFGGTWNAVFIEHADGSVAWYGHMKTGSPTAKNVGETVETGEYLGIVGSSGSSTGPHLHFEVYDSSDNLVDPYSGACNAINPGSWWASQLDYLDTGINKLTTGLSAANLAACPNPDTSYAQNIFAPGNTVYFSAYIRHYMQAITSFHSVRRPDGSVWQSWDHNNTAFHFTVSWWWWWWTLPSSPQGLWTYRVQYDGVTYDHPFLVTTSADHDGDGLPNVWEMENDLDPTDAGPVHGAGGDPDGDGAPNNHEWSADTDPWDAGSTHAVIWMPGVSSVEIGTSVNRNYSLERKRSSQPGMWETVTGQTGIAGTGGTMAFIDPQPPSDAWRHYRIEAETP